MNTENTYVVFTSNHKWGVGKSLPEALINAEWKPSQHIGATLYCCPRKDLEIYNDGSVAYPIDTQVHYLMDEPIQINASLKKNFTKQQKQKKS